MERGQRPCKFGQRCNKLAQGICTFYHPPEQYNNNGPKTSGFNHHRNDNFNQGSNFNDNRTNFNDNRGGNFNDNRGRNYNDNRGGNNGPNQGGFVNNRGGFDNRGVNPNRGPRDEGIDRVVCRSWQIGPDCKFGQKCRNKHCFMVPKEEGMLRLQFIRNLPYHPVSRLTSFTSGGKQFFAMRNGPAINFFQFDFDTKALADVFKYDLPDPNGKYNFYGHKVLSWTARFFCPQSGIFYIIQNQQIYFSKQNGDTMYEDLGVYNLQTMKLNYLQNCHQGIVTGLVHFQENILLSSGMEGELKVWMQEGETLVCHQDSTLRLKSNFNPTNAKIELYFVDVSEVQGIKIVSSGTSDGRILFWLGEAMDFKQVQLGEQYSRVFKLRYAVKQGVPTALILTWNHNQTHSAILEIDLSNFSIRPLVEVSTTQDQPKNILAVFEMIHGYIMVANLHGLLSIYNYPQTGAKVGVIHHQNPLADIVAGEEELKNSSLKLTTVLVLEKKTDRDGSLGIYLLK